MKKAMRKWVSVCLSLVLLLSIMPMAAFAEDTGHIHTFFVSDGGYGYLYADNDCHKVVHFTLYTCECGEDSFKIGEETGKIEPHKALASSREYVGSYIDENGLNVDIYEYLCRRCIEYYCVEEY